MKPSDFIHPEDAAALRQMEGIPGFAALVKKILASGIENLQYGVNMASTICWIFRFNSWTRFYGKKD